MFTNRRAVLRYLYDIIGPAYAWPRQIRHLVYEKRHVKNRERFIVVVFFLTNGIDPDLIGQIMRRLYPQLDAAALRHIAWIIDRYPSSNWTQWNVYQQRSM